MACFHSFFKRLFSYNKHEIFNIENKVFHLVLIRSYVCMSIYVSFERKTLAWNNLKFFWDTPCIEHTIFKAFCSRGTLQIIHSYFKAD